jgi:hypothetical protein
MTLGLGTGSTIRFLLEELAERIDAGRLEGIRGVPTSEDTAAPRPRPGDPTDRPHGRPLARSHHRWRGRGGPRPPPHQRARRRVAPREDRRRGFATRRHRGGRFEDREPASVRAPPSRWRWTPSAPRSRRNSSARSAPSRRYDATPAETPSAPTGGTWCTTAASRRGSRTRSGSSPLLNNRPGVLENGLFLGLTDEVVVARPDGIELLDRSGASR